jgi:hypothetical protein
MIRSCSTVWTAGSAASTPAAAGLSRTVDVSSVPSVVICPPATAFAGSLRAGPSGLSTTM